MVDTAMLWSLALLVKSSFDLAEWPKNSQNWGKKTREKAELERRAVPLSVQENRGVLGGKLGPGIMAQKKRQTWDGIAGQINAFS